MDAQTKAKLFNATLDAEENFLEKVRENGRNNNKPTAGEMYLKGVYNALYNFICEIGMEESFLEWAECPVEEE